MPRTDNERTRDEKIVNLLHNIWKELKELNSKSTKGKKNAAK